MSFLRYAILGTGVAAAVLFIYSVYVFAAEPGNFKPVAYGFLGFTVIFFVLVIVRKIKEDRELRRRMEGHSDDVFSQQKK